MNFALSILGIWIICITATDAVVYCKSYNLEAAKRTGQPLTDLSIQLYKKLAAPEQRLNTLFSPVSVAWALALAEAGASGESRSQLKRLLLPTGSAAQADLSEYYESLGYMLSNCGDAANVSIANSVFYHKDFNMKEDYLNRAVCYIASVNRVDFTKKEEAVEKINRWAANATNNLIQGFLSTHDIDERTKAILTNAIHFQAQWDEEFSRDTNRTFYKFGTDNETQTVRFMWKDDSFDYVEETDYHAVRLPYRDHKFSMYIILPKQRNGLRTLDQSMTGEKFRATLRRMTTRRVEVRMPGFMAKSHARLADTLRSMGLTHAFSDQQSDFSRMSDQPLKISNVIHQARIKVDEKGTEAAAATAVIMAVPVSMQIDQRQKMPFLVDHPFMFAIVEKNTQAVMFMGKINFIEATPRNRRIGTFEGRI